MAKKENIILALQENMEFFLQEILKAFFENIALCPRKIIQSNKRLRQGRLCFQENGRACLEEGPFGEGGGVVQCPLQLLHHPLQLQDEPANQVSQAPGKRREESKNVVCMYVLSVFMSRCHLRSFTRTSLCRMTTPSLTTPAL